MKTPRVTDFDPDAKVPILKSSLDNMPSIQKPTSVNTAISNHIASPVTHRSEPRPAPKAPTRKPVQQNSKRPYVRRTFDFYEDQIIFLTRKSLQERLDGNELSMNEMVRAALDDWINKHNSGK